MSINLIVVLIAVAALAVWYFFLRKASAYSAQNDIIKDIILSLLAALCPILYGLIVGKVPSFEDVLTAEKFTDLIQWVITYAIWGFAAFKGFKAASFAAYRRFAQFK